MDCEVTKLLCDAATARGTIVILTGAGISAESGIPTFRGQEGYWTVGAREYHPQEMATQAAFSQMPREVWRWYLYRRSVCRTANPNAGHDAVTRLEQAFRDRFRLMTQNVDGLHLRAGSTIERTYQIHGNIEYMRCTRPCSTTLHPVPDSIAPKRREDPIADEEWALLVCPDCGERARPHVLWFDEFYDEELFRAQSSIEAAQRADLLVSVGTSGATNLPVQAARIAAQNGAGFIDVNPDDNLFSRLAERLPRGAALRGTASAIVPALVDALIAAAER